MREKIVQQVRDNMHRVAKLGNWPPYINVEDSLPGRVPEYEKKGPGGDAGVGCTLDKIPRDKQRLAAILHAAYTEEAVEQVRRESVDMDPNSETCWWLAMCSTCREGEVTFVDFLVQLEEMDKLVTSLRFH